MNKSNYSKAFKEVYIILKAMGEDVINMIPKEFIEFLENNMEKNYIFILNDNIPIEYQTFLKETLGIISLIYRDYIISEEERKKMYMEDAEKLKEVEKILDEKYEYNNLFKNKKKEYMVNTQEIVVYEEKWYKKIFMKLRKLFKSKE